MTKMVKWWQNIAFWNKFKLICLGLGVSSETGMFLAGAHQDWKIIIGCISFAGVIAGIVMEDKNGNGIVDLFENILSDKDKKKD